MSTHSKNEAAKRRNRRPKRKKNKPASPARMQPPPIDRPVLTMDAGHPLGLIKLGPIVRAKWCVPSRLAQKLIDLGREVPEPVEGHFLVDTGATTTTIGDHVAEELGLVCTGVVESSGMHGRQESELYFARFEIVFPKGGNEKLVVFKEMVVAAAKDLPNGFPDGVEIDGEPLNPIGLIGRDFLVLCQMHYDGGSGKVRLEMDESKINALPPSIPVRAVALSPP